MRSRRIWCASLAVIVWLCGGLSPASAQSAATSYTFNIYAVGATVPTSTFGFPATSVVCAQPAPPGDATTVNPTRLVWDDPASAGQVCQYVAQASDPLLALPLGAYEGRLQAINAAGASAESNRAPFTRDAPLGVLTGFRVIR